MERRSWLRWILCSCILPSLLAKTDEKVTTVVSSSVTIADESTVRAAVTVMPRPLVDVSEVPSELVVRSVYSTHPFVDDSDPLPVVHVQLSTS
jgi:hypothetical protein